jgi:hypothetical protein
MHFDGPLLAPAVAQTRPVAHFEGDHGRGEWHAKSRFDLKETNRYAALLFATGDRTNGRTEQWRLEK